MKKVNYHGITKSYSIVKIIKQAPASDKKKQLKDNFNGMY